MNRPTARLFASLLLLIPLGTAAEEAALGRLFLTPAQRAHLDRQRLLDPGSHADPGEPEGSLTINGEIRRNGGRSVRWINGEAIWTTPPAATAGTAVGDTVHPGSGEREDLLRGGRIIVKPGTDKQ